MKVILGGKQNRWPETLGLIWEVVPDVLFILRTNRYRWVKDQMQVDERMLDVVQSYREMQILGHVLGDIRGNSSEGIGFRELRWSFFFPTFFFFLSLLFKYSCLYFPPTTTPHPSHPHFPPLILPPLALSMCPLYMFLITFPPFLPIIPSHLSSGYCQFVLNFNVSGHILLACLFCWLGSTYRWDHMVFFFHCLTYFV